MLLVAAVTHTRDLLFPLKAYYSVKQQEQYINLEFIFNSNNKFCVKGQMALILLLVSRTEKRFSYSVTCEVDFQTPVCLLYFQHASSLSILRFQHKSRATTTDICFSRNQLYLFSTILDYNSSKASMESVENVGGHLQKRRRTFSKNPRKT